MPETNRVADVSSVEPADLETLDQIDDLPQHVRDRLGELADELVRTKLGDLDPEMTVLDLVEDRIAGLISDEEAQEVIVTTINAAVDDPIGIVPERLEEVAFDKAYDQGQKFAKIGLARLFDLIRQAAG